MLVSLLAVVGQLTLVLAPLAHASRGRSAAAHVERGGTQTHHAHNEATCVACATQGLQALASARPSLALGAPDPRHDGPRGRTDPHPATGTIGSNGPRAPPLT